MSHTNHTQYYELPQYVGSDIINPLVDTNGAYETIDTTLHNIAAEAGQGTSDIAALQSKVGSGSFDTTAQNATDAVNELVGELDTADTGIKARLATAESDIDTLQGQMVTAQGNIVDLQNNKANTSDVNALGTRVGALETTVGDANSGLVKDVNTLKTKVVGGKYITSENVSISGTFSTIADEITELVSVMNNYLASLDDNILVELVGVNIGGAGYFHFTDDIILNNSSVLSGTRNIQNVFSNATKLSIQGGNINFTTPADSLFNTADIQLSDGTVTAHNIPTSSAAVAATNTRIGVKKYRMDT